MDFKYFQEAEQRRLEQSSRLSQNSRGDAYHHDNSGSSNEYVHMSDMCVDSNFNNASLSPDYVPVEALYNPPNQHEQTPHRSVVDAPRPYVKHQPDQQVYGNLPDKYGYMSGHIHSTTVVSSSSDVGGNSTAGGQLDGGPALPDSVITSIRQRLSNKHNNHSR